MSFFHHKGLGNHLLQLCPKVMKHPVFLQARRKIQYSNKFQQVTLDMHKKKQIDLYVNYPLCLPEFYQN